MTQTNNKIFIIVGVKDDGKSTVGYYVSKILNQPTIILDVAKQFKAIKPYQEVIYGVDKLRYWLNNTALNKCFFGGKMELIFRPLKEDFQEEIEEAIRIIFKHKNLLIICEEMELYADTYLNKRSPIFKMFYLSRNQNINIICIVKEIKMLSKMVRSQGDYYLLGQIRDDNAYKYFSEKGKDRDTNVKHFDNHIKGIRKRTFLLTNFDDLFQKITLKKQIIKYL